MAQRSLLTTCSLSTSNPPPPPPPPPKHPPPPCKNNYHGCKDPQMMSQLSLVLSALAATDREGGGEQAGKHWSRGWWGWGGGGGGGVLIDSSKFNRAPLFGVPPLFFPSKRRRAPSLSLPFLFVRRCGSQRRGSSEGIGMLSERSSRGNNGRAVPWGGGGWVGEGGGTAGGR